MQWIQFSHAGPGSAAVTNEVVSFSSPTSGVLSFCASGFIGGSWRRANLTMVSNSHQPTPAWAVWKDDGSCNLTRL